MTSFDYIVDIAHQPYSLIMLTVALPRGQRLKITERGFLERFQIRGIIMPGKDESPIFIDKSGNSASVQPYIPEMGIVQPQ